MEIISQIPEFQNSVLLGYAFEQLANINTRSQYLGPALFPSRRVESLKWEYLSGANGMRIVPVMAGIKEFSSATRTGTRTRSLAKFSGQIPTIGRKMALSIDTLIALKAGEVIKAQYKQAIRDVYDDLESNIAAVAARIEWMRMKAFSEGAITGYNEDGVVLNVDFGVPSAQKVAWDDSALTSTGVNGLKLANHAWTDKVNADPLADLLCIVEFYKSKVGFAPGRMLTSSSVLAYMARAKVLAEQSFGADRANQIITPAQVNALFQAQGIPPIASYDAQVAVENDAGATTSNRLTPVNRIILLPPQSVGNLGETLFGPTPEEIMSDTAYQAEAPRIWADVYVEGHDPGVMYTKCSATAFPTFPLADKVLYFDVYTP